MSEETEAELGLGNFYNGPDGRRHDSRWPFSFLSASVAGLNSPSIAGAVFSSSAAESSAQRVARPSGSAVCSRWL